jgi:peroxiredoxin
MESTLDAIVWGKSLATFDIERGLPEEVEVGYRQTSATRGAERGTMRLAEVKTHDEAWCQAFAADADRYFAARADYQRVLGSQNESPAQRKKSLAKAAADLKAALPGMVRREFRDQASGLLARHDEVARVLIEDAERQAALVGKPAPDWSTTDLDGKAHALKDYRGKVIVLDFWYRNCLWCVRAMPQLKKVATHFKGRPVAVLGMNVDTNIEDARAVVEKMKLEHTNLRAAGLIEKYKVRSFPTLFLIDQKGIVREVRVGYSANLEEEVVRAVEQLLKDKP